MRFRYVSDGMIALAGLVTGCMNDGPDEQQTTAGQPQERRASARENGWRVVQNKVEQVTGDWPAPSKKAVMMMTEKYGPPNELTPTHAVWWNNGPWKYTKVSSMP